MFRASVGSRATAAAATALMFALSACSGDPVAGPLTSPSVTTTTPTSQTPTVPPYLEAYSEQERAVYTDAVTAYDEFLSQGAEFDAAGRATVEAKEFFKRFTTDWRRFFGTLAQLADQGITVQGRPTVLSEVPKRIEADAARGQVVVVRRCLDQSSVKVLQGGQELSQPKDRRFDITTLVKRPDEDWWRVGPSSRGALC